MQDEALRKQLLNLLDGGNAHMSLDDALHSFPKDLINTKPHNVPYTFWHLIEHMRITQKDILEYIINSDYKEQNWPKDYWPDKESEVGYEKWRKTIETFQSDLDELKEMVKKPETDLYAKVAGGEHIILREILLVADHNAYHIGELAILRQVTDSWKSD